MGAAPPTGVCSSPPSRMGDRGAVAGTAVKRDVRSLVGVLGPPAGAGAAAGPELYEQVTHWPRGIPIMGPWCRTVNAVAAATEAAHPGLQFAGIWRGGIGVTDALRRGLAAGEALAV
ncbi:hypothetical protein I4F81_008349 [Pyropia yezoensis]|uniref:Uncharacterized protein n=1 Tax=Pyropia yezoensis TaxID=2788 RepID=A0ACC3C770_PYRYE|nr:hypothetical protein I4F81_008349 [Neopyropia yezoensis]